jgi:hypothetical protein
MEQLIVTDKGPFNLEAQGKQPLPVALGAVMGFAEKLAIVRSCFSALTPCSNVVRLHLIQHPNLGLVGISA